MAKKTLDEKAKEVASDISDELVSFSEREFLQVMGIIKSVLKEQDRDTRHAIATELAGLAGVTNIDGKNNLPVGVPLISKDYAHNIAMNCQGGIS